MKVNVLPVSSLGLQRKRDESARRKMNKSLASQGEANRTFDIAELRVTWSLYDVATGGSQLVDSFNEVRGEWERCEKINHAEQSGCQTGLTALFSGGKS